LRPGRFPSEQLALDPSRVGRRFSGARPFLFGGVEMSKNIVVGVIEDQMPPSTRGGRNVVTLPFDQLNVGQSFTVSGVGRQTLRKRVREYQETNNPHVRLVVGPTDENGVTRIGRKA
jgi:hypothetical protein